MTVIRHVQELILHWCMLPNLLPDRSLSSGSKRRDIGLRGCSSTALGRFLTEPAPAVVSYELSAAAQRWAQQRRMQAFTCADARGSETCFSPTRPGLLSRCASLVAALCRWHAAAGSEAAGEARPAAGSARTGDSHAGRHPAKGAAAGLDLQRHGQCAQRLRVEQCLQDKRAAILEYHKRTVYPVIAGAAGARGWRPAAQHLQPQEAVQGQGSECGENHRAEGHRRDVQHRH